MKNILIMLSTVLCLISTSNNARGGFFSLPDFESNKPENKFSFYITGKIQGMSGNTPLSWIIRNGDTYHAEGFIHANGNVEFSQLKIMADPFNSSAECIVASADPGSEASGNSANIVGGGNSGKLSIVIKSPLSFNYDTLGYIKAFPSIKMIFDDPTGLVSLSNLQEHLSQLQAVQFSSLDLTVGNFSEVLHPTVTGHQLMAAVPSQ